MKKVNFILLAGGKGSRMKTDIPKVLYPIKDGKKNLSSFQRIINLIDSIEGIEKKIYAVISTEIDQNLEFKKQIPGHVISVVQKEKKGTGHAVKVICDYINKDFEDCIIIYCDHPLVQKETILLILKALEKHLFCNLIFFKEEKNNYGKCILADNLSNEERFIVDNINKENKEDFLFKTISIKDIIEEKDIKNREQYLKLCNAMVNLKTDILLKYIDKIQPSQETGEVYLTSLAGLIYNNEKDNYLDSSISKCVGLIVEEDEIVAFNTLEELALIENMIAQRL